jgi:cell wall-associated NlpC family hydrolase
MPTTFIVGPGIAAAMTQDGTTPASDEIYTYGNQTAAQWSEALGRNGVVYRWVQSTNGLYRTTAGTAGGGLAGRLQQVVDAGRAKGWKPYSGPIVNQPESYRWGNPGYDCSSFVASMYREALGITLPGFTDAIAAQTDQIDEPAALPGDIILYRYVDTSQPGVRFPHTGLWLANGRMLDCQFHAGLGEHPLLAHAYELHRVRGL